MRGAVTLLVVAGILAEAALCQKQPSYYKKSAVVMTTANERFNLPVWSLVQCANFCSEDESCIRFTMFVGHKGKTRCRGHDTLVTFSSMHVYPAPPMTYTLRHPARKTDECASGPCSNNGHCVDLIKAFKCDCATGWTGATCDTPTAPLGPAEGVDGKGGKTPDIAAA